ncbi:MAG: cardiolipin synthase [Verrucomicrobia bacterium]|nr:MAG: cardiolipin synthase [Verrucomicrobiota bacterium]
MAWWHWLGGGAVVILSLAASVHAILYKRDPRATVLWVAFIWFSPVVGPLAYLLLGINRIRRRATRKRADLEHCEAPPPLEHCPPPEIPARLEGRAAHLEPLAHLTQRLTGRPLLPGNRITPLVNGDEAFPAMLEAIDQARHSVHLSTYIFDRDPSGLEFAAALERAVRRGVQVRVLIDDAGARYSFPSIFGELRRRGVGTARFMPRFVLLRLAALNLRNHRKILVIDGRLGFTGGMNIREGNRLSRRPRHPIRDLHFRVEGPVVAQLQEVFLDDWAWCTGERLQGPEWFPELKPVGDMLARAISDGPDEELDRLVLTLNGAFAAARRSIRIATPYFLPDATTISALNTAALRGVDVDILLPSENNLPFVQWASTALWWQVLLWGCRIWLSPPPFDHSKLLVVDDIWSFVGSSNLDPRSLRLNFEFNLEVYSPELAGRLTAWFEERRRVAHQVTLEEVNGRPWPRRLRDGIARLATPFL